MIEIGTSGRGSVILRVYVPAGIQIPRIDVPEGSVVEVHITHAKSDAKQMAAKAPKQKKHVPRDEKSREVSLDAPLPTPRQENVKPSALKLGQQLLERERLDAEMDEYFRMDAPARVADGQPVNPAIASVEPPTEPSLTTAGVIAEIREADHDHDTHCWGCASSGLEYPSSRGMRNPYIKDPNHPYAWTQPDSSDSSDTE